MAKNDELSATVIDRISKIVDVANQATKERRQRNLARAAAAAMPKETKHVPEIRRERGEIGMAERVLFLTDADGKPTRTVKRIVPVVLSQTDRMWKRGEISFRQKLAGEKLAEAFDHAQVSIRSILDLDRTIGKEDGRRLDEIGMGFGSLFEIERAIDAMGRLAHIVLYVAVCGLPASQWCEAHKLQARAGTDILKLGLDALADHYGLDRD